MRKCGTTWQKRCWEQHGSPVLKQVCFRHRQTQKRQVLAVTLALFPLKSIKPLRLHKYTHINSPHSQTCQRISAVITINAVLRGPTTQPKWKDRAEQTVVASQLKVRYFTSIIYHEQAKWSFQACHSPTMYQTYFWVSEVLVFLLLNGLPFKHPKKMHYLCWIQSPLSHCSTLGTASLPVPQEASKQSPPLSAN